MERNGRGSNRPGRVHRAHMSCHRRGSEATANSAIGARGLAGIGRFGYGNRLDMPAGWRSRLFGAQRCIPCSTTIPSQDGRSGSQLAATRGTNSKTTLRRTFLLTSVRRRNFSALPYALTLYIVFQPYSITDCSYQQQHRKDMEDKTTMKKPRATKSISCPRICGNGSI